MNTNQQLVAFELLKAIRHAAESANAFRESHAVREAFAVDNGLWQYTGSAMSKALEMGFSLNCEESSEVSEFLRSAVSVAYKNARYNTEFLLKLQEGLTIELAKVGSYPSIW